MGPACRAARVGSGSRGASAGVCVVASPLPGRRGFQHRGGRGRRFSRYIYHIFIEQQCVEQYGSSGAALAQTRERARTQHSRTRSSIRALVPARVDLQLFSCLTFSPLSALSLPHTLPPSLSPRCSCSSSRAPSCSSTSSSPPPSTRRAPPRQGGGRGIRWGAHRCARETRACIVHTVFMINTACLFPLA